MLTEPVIFEDVWESDPADLLPRSDIVSTLTIRRLPSGIACHLRVEYNGDTCELPTAVGSVGQAAGWLGLYDTGRFVTRRLGLPDADAFAFCKRWLDRFTGELQSWHRRST